MIYAVTLVVDVDNPSLSLSLKARASGRGYPAAGH